MQRAAAEWHPDRWERLEITTWDRTARVALNGEPVLSAEGLSPARGKIGLYAEGAGARFDDLAMDSAAAFWDDFSSGSAYRWEAVSGQPQVKGGLLCLRANSDGVALARTPAWDSYSVECRTVGGRGGAGLVFGWTGPTDFWSLDCTEGGGWLLQRRSLEGTKVVAKGTLAAKRAERGVRVAVDGELVECYLDSRLVHREATRILER